MKKEIGVYWRPAYGRWSASYSIAGSKVHIGNYLKKEDAIKAYWRAVDMRNKNIGIPVEEIDGEEWRVVKGSKIHMVSNMGRVKTLSYNRTGVESLMKLAESNGYLRVQVQGNKSPRLVHRIVWESFIGNIPEGNQINHLNRNKHDNRLVNLEVCSASRNQNHYLECIGKRKYGVWKDEDRGGWVAVIEKDERPWYLGVYDSQKDAVLSYEAAIRK